MYFKLQSVWVGGQLFPALYQTRFRITCMHHNLLRKQFMYLSLRDFPFQPFPNAVVANNDKLIMSYPNQDNMHRCKDGCDVIISYCFSWYIAKMPTGNLSQEFLQRGFIVIF